MDSLRETDWASRSLRKSGREIDQASGRLQSMLGRQPSETEIARELGISAERFQMIQGQIHSMKVLVQQAAHAHDDSELTDLIESAPNENDPNPLEIYLAGERKALLAEAVSRLTERERSIVQLYYREESSMKEISEALGISLSRVSQLRESIMAKLRESLKELRVRPVSRSLREDERSVDVP